MKRAAQLAWRWFLPTLCVLNLILAIAQRDFARSCAWFTALLGWLSANLWEDIAEMRATSMDRWKDMYFRTIFGGCR